MSFGFGMGFTRNDPFAGGPSLNLQFAGNTVLDPSITFTRALNTATYFNSAGLLTTANANVPRFDYDPSTLAPRGLLIEEQRTNLLLQSEDFATTWTTNSSPTITTNTTTAPDGTTTADTITSTATASYVAQTVTFTGDGTKTFSIFIKAGTSGRSAVFLRDATAAISRGSATITWSGGVPSVAVVNGSLQYLQACPNGWYRLAIIVDGVVVANSNQLRIQPDNLVGTGSLIVWGAQIENAAFSTSYIPTTTTALTRNTDVASVNTLSPWFNATAGTLYAEVQRPSSASNNGAMAGFNDGSTNNRLQTRIDGATNNTNFIVLAGAVNYTGSFTFISGGVNKAALAYETNNVNSAGNGVVGTTDTSEVIPTGLTKLDLGQVGGAGVLNGWLRRATYYPRRLSNAELQAITA